MTDNNEISSAPMGAEASAEDVQEVAEQMREVVAATQEQAKKEASFRQADNQVVDILIKVLQNSSDLNLLKLIVAALRQDTPPALILATISPLFPEVDIEINSENEGLFVDETWPEEDRKIMSAWEKKMLGSLENQKEHFHDIINKNDGDLPEFAELAEYVIQKKTQHESVSGEHILHALIEHTAS